METKIFISYRRQDTDASAGRLYDTMSQNYNPESLFKDIDSIPLGADFKEIIESKIRECNIVLAIIGKNFIKIKDNDGIIRIFNPEDFVNMELSTAIKEKKIVIPVLVDDAVIPKVSELPENLNKLPYLNGIKLRHDSWHRDTNKLFAEISKIIDSQNQTEEAKKQKNEEKIRKKAERLKQKRQDEKLQKDVLENKRKIEEENRRNREIEKLEIQKSEKLTIETNKQREQKEIKEFKRLKKLNKKIYKCEHCGFPIEGDQQKPSYYILALFLFFFPILIFLIGGLVFNAWDISSKLFLISFPFSWFFLFRLAKKKKNYVKEIVICKNCHKEVHKFNLYPIE